MNERRRLLLLAGFMSLATLAVVTLAVGMLYRVTINVRREGLLQLAIDRASLAQTLAARSDDPAETVNQIRRAFEDTPGLGKTGEVTLARREGDRMVWLVARRFGTPTGTFSLPIKGDLAEPMQRALRGERGTMIGRDYRGRTVLAAYALTPDPGWAVVAKVDLAEARAPFWHASVVAVGLTLLLVLAGTALFLGITDPVVRRLRVSEERYRSLFEQSPIGIYRTTPSGSILMANPALLNMLGYASLEELSTRNLEEMDFQPDYPRHLFKDALKRDGRVRGFEAAWPKRNGEPVYVRENADAVRAPDGAVLYYEGTVEDVSERRRAELALRASEERLQRTLDSMQEGVQILAPDWTYLYVNESAARHGKTTRDELIGRRMPDVYPGIENTEMFATLRKCRDEREPGRMENLFTYPDGSQARFDLGIQPVQEGVFVLSADVTDRKLAESLLRARLDLSELAATGDLDTLIQAALDAAEQLTHSEIGFFHFVDADQENLTLQAWSTNTLRGMCQAEGKGLHYPISEAGVWVDCFHARAPVIHNDYASLPHRKGMPEGHASVAREIVVPVLRNDIVVAIMGVGNKPVDYVQQDVEVVEALTSMLMDLVDRKRAEDDLLRLNADLEDRVRQRMAELEAANEELEAFSYSVSHDLRAPLRAIDGYAQALLEDCSERLDEPGRGYLDRVRANAQRMGRLIDDLLKLSRVTRAKVRAEEVSISAIAASIAKELRRKEPGRRVDVAIAKDLASTGDPRLIEALLTNLLGNAWKFTARRPHAHIEVGAADYDGERAFFVRDDGAGFDMAYSDKLFGAFQRLHSSAEFEGTGIGLATVKRIAHRHGGRVWAEGAVDSGATFYFTLPAPQGAEPASGTD
jgi:PAS domain S-box-containing protein